MTTMYVDGDSTTSWTLYQLEKDDEIYAGRDTVVGYCSEGVRLDLRTYLTPGVDREAGYFSPEPSGGGSIFVTDTDPDGEYLYIIEKGSCADTAVITIRNEGRSPIELDTVWLCAGERKRIGFSPGKYSYVEWWDGSRGDSLWVEGTAEEQHSVTVGFDNCNIVYSVNILLRPASEIAGEDKVIPYCADGDPFSLTEFLPAPEDYTFRPEPSFEAGDLTFTPGTDPPGEYRYILTPADPEAGCPDTAIITMEESSAGEIGLEPVRLCAGSALKVGLPAGAYQNIRWWNGDTADSTLVTDDDAGTLWVEAERDGCAYHGSFAAEVVPAPGFPDHFPERLEWCAGEEARLGVEDLDSVRWEGRTYLEGEELVFTEAGSLLPTGYRNGCPAEKEIFAAEVPDLSDIYRSRKKLCEGEETEIRLPEETADVRFEWKEGDSHPVRPAHHPGEYPFLILTEGCVFESAVEVVPDEDCDAAAERCTVSLPNAVAVYGENNRLQVYATCEIRVREIRIFDRWGGQRYAGREEVVGYEVWERLPPDVYLVEVTYEQAGKGVRKITETVMVVK